MPWAVAAAGLAAAGTIGGAVISSNASGKAVDAQQAAANTAIAEQQREFNQTQTNLYPWLSVGTGALGQLATLYGITPTSPAAFSAANGGPAAPGSAGGLTPGMIAAQAAGPHSQNGVTNGIVGDVLIGPGLKGLFKQNASPIQDIAAALAQGLPVTDADWAKAGYGPGGSAPGSQPGSATAVPTTPTSATPAPQTFPSASGTGTSNVDPYATFYQSPDYQFALAQGLKGVQASAAANGSLDSGATRKAEIAYAGNLASQDYNSYAERLANLAGVGGNTATNLGLIGANTAKQIGTYAIDQGNNRASSYNTNGQTYANTISQLANMGSGLIVNNGGGGSGGASPYGTPTTPGYVNWGF